MRMIAQFTYLFICGIAITIIGALPLGLVNLTVFNEASLQHKSRPMQIAAGAAMVELLFAFLGLYSGNYFVQLLNAVPFVKQLIVAFITVVAIYFLLKNQNGLADAMHTRNSFIKGLVLNIVSFQVLFYWIAAIAVAYSFKLLSADNNNWLLLLGVFPAKMAVLRLYQYLGIQARKYQINLTPYMNKLVGSILLIIAIIQEIKL